MTHPTGSSTPIGRAPLGGAPADPTSVLPTTAAATTRATAPAPTPTTPPGPGSATGPAAPAEVPPAPYPSGRDVPPARGGQARRVQPPAALPLAGPAAAPAVPRDGGERRRRKAPLPWLPWALLAALVTLLALMLLAGTLGGDDAADDGTADAAGPVAGPVAQAGTLVADGTDLLADRASLGRLGAAQGQEAVGRGLSVQSVVADEGFWVGPSAAQRSFVFLTPAARRSSGESDYRVQAGQRVDLVGTVTGISPGDPARFGVTDAEGARQLAAQRAYVRAAQVRLSS